MHRQTLDCQDIVLRAVLRSAYIDRENNRVRSDAFMLRPLPKDEDGLSVSFDCEPAQSASQFKKCYGVASLHVGRIRDLGLDVVPDDVTHANVTGLLRSDDNPAEAEHFASQLAKQARLVWQP